MRLRSSAFLPTGRDRRGILELALEQVVTGWSSSPPRTPSTIGFRHRDADSGREVIFDPIDPRVEAGISLNLRATDKP
jgi:hypothetical protein